MYIEITLRFQILNLFIGLSGSYEIALISLQDQNLKYLYDKLQAEEIYFKLWSSFLHDCNIDSLI